MNLGRGERLEVLLVVVLGWCWCWCWESLSRREGSGLL